tara:strand:+ start:305 stop:1243 length:939 start_codon:yes stop_codon:yes gene_type:complete
MVHVVTAHWNEDLQWLHDLNDEFQYLTISVCDKLSNPNYAGSGECDVDTNHGHEASAYLKYIINHYDTLPNNICFIHGHDTAWHQKYSMSEVLSRVHTNKKLLPDFCSLNAVLTPDPDAPHEVRNWARGRDRMKESFPKFYDRYMKHRYTGNSTQYDCCAQFCTTNDKIRKLPKEAYELLARELLQCRDGHGMTERCAATLEMNWHKIIGGMPDRVQDGSAWLNAIMTEKSFEVEKDNEVETVYPNDFVSGKLAHSRQRGCVAKNGSEDGDNYYNKDCRSVDKKDATRSNAILIMVILVMILMTTITFKSCR